MTMPFPFWNLASGRRVLCFIHTLLAPAIMGASTNSYVEQWPHVFVDGGVTNILYQPETD
jgi:hypothetical protein